MKIQVQCLRNFNTPGGGTSYCLRVAREFAAMGHSVTALCPKRAATEEDTQVFDGIRTRVHDQPERSPILWRFWALGLVKRYLPIVEQYASSADLIVSHSIPYAAAAKRLFPDKTVCYFFGGIESQNLYGPLDKGGFLRKMRVLIDRRLLYGIERQMLCDVDAVLCASPRNIRRIEKWFHLQGKHWYVCPQGVDDLREWVVEERHCLRSRFDTPQDAPVVLTACDLNPNKNTQAILRALACCRSRTTHLWIAGGGVERGLLERLAGELGIAPRVRFLGFVDDMPDIYGAVDYFALASIYETFPHVFLEAMVSGLPVLGPRHDEGKGFSAADEVMVDGESGFVFDRDSSADLANHMDRLSDDEKLRKRMGQAARERALKMFSWRKHAARIIEIAKAQREGVVVHANSH